MFLRRKVGNRLYLLDPAPYWTRAKRQTPDRVNTIDSRLFRPKTRPPRRHQLHRLYVKCLEETTRVLAFRYHLKEQLIRYETGKFLGTTAVKLEGTDRFHNTLWESDHIQKL